MVGQRADAGTDDAAPAARQAGRRWWWGVAAIVGIAFVVRVVYVMLVSRHVHLGSDSTWYFLQRGSLYDGAGYIDPQTRFRTGAEVSTATFPPMYPVYLWLVRIVGGESQTVAFLAGAPMGALTALLAALLGRRLLGPAVGLMAAAIVAFDPVLIAADGSMMSEVVYVPLVVLATLVALVAGERSRWWPWIALGATCALAALTRQEALLLVVTLIVPIMWWSSQPRRRTALGVLASVVVLGLVVAPWVVRNQRELGEATISTSSPAMSLAGSNCDLTYGGASIGSWEFACTHPEDRTTLRESAWDAELRSGALSYARAHAGRLPLVLPARELRVWGMWNPSDLVARDIEENRSAGFQWLAWSVALVTLVGGIAGIIRSRTIGRHVVVLVGPIAMVAITALVSHGNPRFRTVAEPMLAIGLAAIIVRVAARWRSRRPMSPSTRRLGVAESSPVP